MISIKALQLLNSKEDLTRLPMGKLLVNTINAFSYNNARKDQLFADALTKCDVLLPDGISIVKACRWLNSPCQPAERVAGWDIFVYEMDRLNAIGAKAEAEGKPKPHAMFLGSSDHVLSLIRQNAGEKYPNVEIDTYSPPFKTEFSEEENAAMVKAVNDVNPDVLWVGMTAPKQEKWAYSNYDALDIHCHIGTIGAVFDFFAGTAERAPLLWQQWGLEWLFRLLKEPRRMWRRYLIGNVEFLYYVFLEKWKR